MFAAVIPNRPARGTAFAFNWFDVALVLVLAFGFWRGRKRGMTKELLPTLQWLPSCWAPVSAMFSWPTGFSSRACPAGVRQSFQ
jgi:hypothetical protein